MSKPLPAILGEDEIARYEQDGLLIPRYRLPADLLPQIRKQVDGLIAANPNVRPELLLDVNVEDDRLGKREHTGNRNFLRYAVYPPLLRLLEQLIGPDILLWDC